MNRTGDGGIFGTKASLPAVAERRRFIRGWTAG